MIELTYDEFCKKFTEQLQVLLGDSYLLKQEEAIGYNDTHKEVLLVEKKGSGCMPRFDLKAYYETHIQGMTIEELAKKAVHGINAEDIPSEEEIQALLDPKQIRSRLIVRLLNRKTNESILKEMPHLPFLDLAITFHLLVEEKKDGTKSVRVTNKLWEEYIGDSVLQMYKQALLNTEHLFPARMVQMEKLLHLSELGISSGLFIVSNPHGIYGAAVLLYEGVQEKIKQILGEDYYVIPSSVHEVLVIRESDVTDIEMLKSTILEVNRTQVGEEDILSNLLYKYQNQQLICV